MKEHEPKISVSSSHKIIGNTILSTLSELSLVFVSLFYIMAARFLGKIEFGKLGAARGFVGLFTLLVLFGLNYSITKAIVKQKDKTGQYLGNALLIQGFLTAIAYAGCLFAATLLKASYTPEVRQLIAVIFIAEALRCFILTLRAGTKALGHFHYDTIAVNAERLFLFVVGLAALIMGYGIFVLGCILLISRIISFSLLFVSIARTGHPIRLRPELAVLKDLAVKSWIYVLQAGFLRIYDHIDVVMISLMRPIGEVGLYSAGRQILEGLWFIPNMLTEVTYPEINARQHISTDLVIQLFDKALKYMLVISVIVSLGTVVIARFLIGAVYGPDFEGTIAVLTLLGAAIVPSYLRYLFGNTLIAMNLQKKVIYFTIARSVVNVLLNLILIIHYGYIGATVATVATEYFTLVVYLIYLYHLGMIRKSQLTFIYKPFVAAAVTAPLFFLFRGSHDIFKFLMILSIYILILFAMRFLSLAEMAEFKGFLRRKQLNRNM